MTPSFRVSLIQLAVRDGEPDLNVARAAEMIAGSPAADLYVLPELWTTGYAHALWANTARTGTPAALDTLGAIARRTGAWIAGSTIAVGESGALVNRLSVVGPHGSVIAAYDKAHLFEPMGEADHLQAGGRRVRAGIGMFTAGLSICYDLRFPEMYRRDALDGADLFLVSSAWPASRVAVMGVLATARAAENQAFVVLCNRAGPADDGTVFGGESCVVGPDGAVICRAGATEGVVAGQLTTTAVPHARGTSPLLAQRVAGIDWQE